jgi:hypothetical protein
VLRGSRKEDYKIKRDLFNPYKADYTDVSTNREYVYCHRAKKKREIINLRETCQTFLQRDVCVSSLLILLLFLSWVIFW